MNGHYFNSDDEAIQCKYEVISRSNRPCTMYPINIEINCMDIIERIYENILHFLAKNSQIPELLHLTYSVIAGLTDRRSIDEGLYNVY